MSRLVLIFGFLSLLALGGCVDKPTAGVISPAFCKTHASDPRCIVTLEYCNAHPDDTRCAATPDYCTAHPDDARCATAGTHAPTAPELVAPANDLRNMNAHRGVQLTWSASTDPDAGDRVTYVVRLGTDPSDLPTISAADFTGLTLSPAGRLNSGRKYYWQVVAVDTEGHSTESAVWSFRTQSILSTPAFRLLLNKS